MSVSMYQISVPVYLRGLGALKGLLEKAEAHAAAQGTDGSELVEARLAPDMIPLSGQVQRASDASKFTLARLTGIAAPPMEDNETTLAQLKDRVDRTIAYLQSVNAADLDGAEGKTVALKFGAFEPTFQGDDYVLSFALPNFFFHVTAAYAILRHKGVALGKLDYLGPYEG